MDHDFGVEGGNRPLVNGQPMGPVTFGRPRSSRPRRAGVALAIVVAVVLRLLSVFAPGLADHYVHRTTNGYVLSQPHGTPVAAAAPVAQVLPAQKWVVLVPFGGPIPTRQQAQINADLARVGVKAPVWLAPVSAGEADWNPSTASLDSTFAAMAVSRQLVRPTGVSSAPVVVAITPWQTKSVGLRGHDFSSPPMHDTTFVRRGRSSVVHPAVEMFSSAWFGSGGGDHQVDQRLGRMVASFVASSDLAKPLSTDPTSFCSVVLGAPVEYDRRPNGC